MRLPIGINSKTFPPPVADHAQELHVLLDVSEVPASVQREGRIKPMHLEFGRLPLPTAVLAPGAPLFEQSES